MATCIEDEQKDSWMEALNPYNWRWNKVIFWENLVNTIVADALVTS